MCLDESVELVEDEDEEYFTSEEASKVRKELNHLSFITREVLIRFYFGNQSVSDIAEGLGIPEGTVYYYLGTMPDKLAELYSNKLKTHWCWITSCGLLNLELYTLAVDANMTSLELFAKYQLGTQ